MGCCGVTRGLFLPHFRFLKMGEVWRGSAEIRLWWRLRGHRMKGVHFRNQNAIGNYVVDFCAPRRKLIIELDGNQHLDQEKYDMERTAFLESKGYRVLRFWNHQVMNDIEGVLSVIYLTLENE
jgi:very-short-patch-repair endonuclease